MSRPELVIEAARAVVDGGERPCSVAVSDGRVVGLDVPTGTDADRLVPLGDDVVLMPGVVDTHVHVNEPGRTEWEGFAHATRAAAAGGVTTIVDMPLNSVPPTVDLAGLEAKLRAAEGQCHVDVGFWGGAVPGNTRDLRGLWDAGVFGFKCFLVDSGVEEFPAVDGPGLHGVMDQVASFGGLVLVHAEDPDAVAPVPPGRHYSDFLASRPESAEVSAVATVVDAAHRTGCRTHVVHVSTAQALPILTGAHARGVPVTAETCPHYLALSAEEVADGATAFKCCPPVRDAANRERLWAALADGALGCVVSDHSPSPPSLKALDTGDFAAAWGGISSLQLALPVVWTEARRRGHDLVDVARWMCEGPARRAGLGRKGRIEVGADADFCVLAPDETSVVDPARLAHRSPVTPYAGRELCGVVRETWLAGRRVELTSPPRGRLLRRGDDR
jgi:allantoinase